MRKVLIKIRSAILVFLTHQIALPLLKIVRRPNLFAYSREELAQFPDKTLGHDLFLFLQKRNLPLLKHYARHDLKHVLLNYDTTDEGEACLQCFMLGNGRISFPVLATVLYSFISMPEHWGKMRRAFLQGRSSTSFHHWQWNELLYEPTSRIRNKIFDKH
ncbi:MAG: hypothetical protein ACT4OJ_00540 [Bacteroidota bacterium]